MPVPWRLATFNLGEVEHHYTQHIWETHYVYSLSLSLCICKMPEHFLNSNSRWNSNLRVIYYLEQCSNSWTISFQSWVIWAGYRKRPSYGPRIPSWRPDKSKVLFLTCGLLHTSSCVRVLVLFPVTLAINHQLCVYRYWSQWHPFDSDQANCITV